MDSSSFSQMSKNTVYRMLKFISSATSPYHVVQEGISILQKAGFKELDITKSWELKNSSSYYVKPYGTSLFAFTTGKRITQYTDFHIAAAHTDFPCMHIKPIAELLSNQYLKLNIEVYGTPILNTWMDRPLSIAGRVALRTDNVYKPNMIVVDVKRPVLTIPNLAIHINHNVNKGVELKKQEDMIPLLGKIDNRLNQKNYFLNFIANEIGVNPSEILDFDLYIYNAEQGKTVGMNEDFISSPRLDNLTSCFALLKSIVTAKRRNGINLIALYDNEEIGSQTKQGADSTLLSMILEKIYSSFGGTKAMLNEAIMRSFLLSVDVAHAIHPNHSERYDYENYAAMNDGVVFKINSNQKYTFDTEAVAVACQICEKANIKYKKFANHSDISGGKTIGSIISSWLPMKTVDVGIPILAMHSARELMGAEDQLHLEKMVTAFFSKL